MKLVSAALALVIFSLAPLSEAGALPPNMKSRLRDRLFCLIILWADKELFPPHQCRRSAGGGFHCRPDEP
jgi:hypothetical protein